MTNTLEKADKRYTGWFMRELREGDRIPFHMGGWRFRASTLTYSCMLIPFNVLARVLWLMYLWLLRPFFDSPREAQRLRPSPVARATHPGDVIQINADVEQQEFANCVMVVDRIHSHGVVRCYVHAPGRGLIYFRAQDHQYQVVGAGARVS